MLTILGKLNLAAECRSMRLKPWQCPPFLVLTMGIIIILSMVATYFIAARYTEEPEIAALIVIGITALFLVTGNLIVNGFNRIAEANRMKSEFIAIVSHQLRSPLSIFKWTLDIFDRKLKEWNDSSMENFLGTLHDTTEKMIRLVNSLLEVSRIDAGTFTLHKTPVVLDKLTEEILKDFRKYAEASNITLTLDSPPSLQAVLGDKERIAMVIQNLVDNAVRYTHESGNITIRIETEGSRLRWSVQDQGVGIPEAEQKFIFQKFFRAGNVRNEQTRGSGIGLYIAKIIVEVSGGEIGFSSEQDKGSRFWFTLPISQ